MYSHAPPDYDCPFCGYAGGVYNDFVAASHEVERTSETLTFISPKWWINNEGHVIVIPLQHVENLYELPETLAVPLLGAVRRAALALKSAYQCDGTSVRQHNEPAGDQELWHLHITWSRLTSETATACSARTTCWTSGSRPTARHTARMSTS